MKFRHLFKLLFSRIYVRIKSGPLKDCKWIVTSGRGFVNGTQESYKTEAFLKHFHHGDVFFDIGAHIGYYSAIAARINGSSGKIFAFEPRPMNAGFFKRHMKINNFQNVTLFEVAVGDSDTDVRFDTRHGSATGSVSLEGNLKVKQVSIGRMVDEGKLPSPDFIKIDVEGGEIEVLKGLAGVIFSSRPKMIIATHNTECHSFVVEFLNKNNYKFEILNPEHIKGDTEIIALPQQVLK
jgi:FkbM family methyltransferase